jgi:hypothetical protein
MLHHGFARWRRGRRALAAAAAAVALAGAVACEHPIAVVTPHLEAQDALVYDTTGVLIARTHDNRSWSGGPLAITDRDALPIVVRFLDFAGQEFGVGDRRDLSLRLETETDGVVGWEPLTTRALLHALSPGTTRVRFIVWHVSHPDFITPWIPVAVTAAPSSQELVP